MDVFYFLFISSFSCRIIFCIFSMYLLLFFCGTWTSESVKSCSSSATMYELAAHSMLPLDGAVHSVSLQSAWHFHLSLKNICHCFRYVQSHQHLLPDKRGVQFTNHDVHRHPNSFTPPPNRPVDDATPKSAVRDVSRARRALHSHLPPCPHIRPSISCDTCPISPMFGPRHPLMSRNPPPCRFAASDSYLLHGQGASSILLRTTAVQLTIHPRLARLHSRPLLIQYMTTLCEIAASRIAFVVRRCHPHPRSPSIVIRNASPRRSSSTCSIFSTFYFTWWACDNTKKNGHERAEMCARRLAYPPLTRIAGSGRSSATTISFRSLYVTQRTCEHAKKMVMSGPRCVPAASIYFCLF
jgi:hypothetical protein